MSKSKPGSTVTAYAGRMSKFSDQDIDKLISSQYLYDDFSDKIQMLSEKITDPANCYVMLKSKDFEGKLEKKSSYYFAPYSRTSLKDEGILDQL